MRAHNRAALHQQSGNIQRWSVAQVVGVRLEAEAQKGDMPALENLEAFLQSVHHPGALAVVYLAGSLHNWHLELVIARGCHERGSILAETRAAPTDSGVQEARSDAVIQADALRNQGGIRAHPLGQPGNLVDVRNLERQKRVGSVFDDLRAGQVAHQ